MNFSEALIHLKNNCKLLRNGWNGKNLYVFLYQPDSITMCDYQTNEDTVVFPHFRIWDTQRKNINSWVPSISDIMAEDWVIYKE